MKHLILITACLIGLISCNPKATTTETAKEQSADTSMTGNHPHLSTSNTGPDGQDLNITPPAGGITLAELIGNKKKYEGQKVKVQGRVVKLNNMIMERNWIHLKDASLKDGKMDLTVTSTDNVAKGDVVAFEGTITLNKDFGSGYTYEIIMEDAHIIR